MTNDRFREALTVDSGDLRKAETKDAMGTLMRIAGYNKKFNKDLKRMEKRFPTQTQLDYAWKFIKKGQVFIDKKEYWIISTYEDRYGNERIVRIAKDNVYIRGKLYKKGQFVPKHPSG